MRHFVERRARFCLASFSFLISLVFAGPFAEAQTALTVTNLAQLRNVMSLGQQVVADLRLDATVFACDTNPGALVLDDGSGAEILEMDGLKTEFAPGDRIEIDKKSTLLSPSDVGVHVSSAPLLNNDGLHSARTVSHEYSFEAGRYPLRLDWFNRFSAFELEATCVATKSEQPSLTNLVQATRAECFIGSWTTLPNFQLFRPVKVGP